ncbi:MAG: chemotaxis protein CheW [Alphaproteobacteria bacterium]|nr:chemotaxis protein CheW [Alphaproteobacteria bacterium]
MLVVPFEVARYLFALPLDRVMRVEPMAELVALPRPIANVAGALVHGGRALAVYDLRSKFRLGDRGRRASDCLVLSRARARSRGGGAR